MVYPQQVCCFSNVVFWGLRNFAYPQRFRSYVSATWSIQDLNNAFIHNDFEDTTIGTCSFIRHVVYPHVFGDTTVRIRFVFFPNWQLRIKAFFPNSQLRITHVSFIQVCFFLSHLCNWRWKILAYLRRSWRPHRKNLPQKFVLCFSHIRNYGLEFFVYPRRSWKPHHDHFGLLFLPGGLLMIWNFSLSATLSKARFCRVEYWGLKIFVYPLCFEGTTVGTRSCIQHVVYPRAFVDTTT